MATEPVIRNHAAFIWSVADKLRGVYKQSEYGRVILPLVVLRRLDCVLEPTKAAVLARHEALKGRVENVAPVLESVAGEQFYNTSPLDFRRLLDDPANVAGNLRSYIAGFSPAARDVIEKFGFDPQIIRLERANLLYLVVSQFAEIDLHPDRVSNVEMGYLYEELVRKFSELSNETAGEHFTPREVIRLMVNLLFVEDEDVLTRRGIVKTLYDPACGTGGMLSVAEDYLRELNPDARLEVYALLRALAGGGVGSFDFGVVWMLTPSDGRSDGGKLGYLDRLALRELDPLAFDTLAELVSRGDCRVSAVEESALMPSAVFVSDRLADSLHERQSYFRPAAETLHSCPLVFFDPDNGLAVASVSRGARNSAKYLYWDEAAAFYTAGSSLLIYQHFPRVTRHVFMEALEQRARAELACDNVFSLTTSHVAFLIVAREEHASDLKQRLREFGARAIALRLASTI